VISLRTARLPLQEPSIDGKKGNLHIVVAEQQEHHCSYNCRGTCCKQNLSHVPCECTTVSSNHSWRLMRSTSTYDTYCPSIACSLGATQRIHVFTNGATTLKDVGEVAHFLGQPPVPVSTLGVVSTMIGDVCHNMFIPGWMDNLNSSTRLLAGCMIAVTRLNEIATELKVFMLFGPNHCSSHPSKIINWYLLQKVMESNYPELRT
jgi:hypothetical protein